jgi:hypothetical protein
MSADLLEPHQCKVLQGLFTWMAEGLHANKWWKVSSTNQCNFRAGMCFQNTKKKTL